MKRRGRVGFLVMLMVGLSQGAPASQASSPRGESAEMAEAVEEYARSGRAPVLFRGETRKYPFGASTPVLNCAPLRVCAVRLEAGEEVYDVLAGDTARWMQYASRSGPGGETPILAFTPILDPERTCDVTTNVVVTTSKRIYSFLLNVAACDRKEIGGENPMRPFDSLIEFYYPEDVLRRWQAEESRAAAAEAGAARREPVRAGSVDELHWRYELKREGRKRFPWRPVVFDDGERTFLRMPEAAREVPGIFLKSGKGLELVNWKRDPEDPQQLIVEGVHRELVLTLPDGKRPRKLSVRREASDG